MKTTVWANIAHPSYVIKTNIGCTLIKIPKFGGKFLYEDTALSFNGWMLKDRVSVENKIDFSEVVSSQCHSNDSLWGYLL